eukprot:351646-Amphidinium_carterae.1
MAMSRMEKCLCWRTSRPIHTRICVWGDVSAWVPTQTKHKLLNQDEGISPNQEYEPEATQHVVNGIVERTQGAKNLVVGDMNESRQVPSCT